MAEAHICASPDNYPINPRSPELDDLTWTLISSACLQAARIWAFNASWIEEAELHWSTALTTYRSAHKYAIAEHPLFGMSGRLVFLPDTLAR